jgi:hypothetical protein
MKGEITRELSREACASYRCSVVWSLQRYSDL